MRDPKIYLRARVGREWARDVVGVGSGGWPVVAARLAGWCCMIGSMPRMSVRAQAHLPWLLNWCERAVRTSTRALAGQRPWWSQSQSVPQKAA